LNTLNTILALCFAVAAGDTKVVKLLLEKGANCNDKMPMKVFHQIRFINPLFIFIFKKVLFVNSTSFSLWRSW
jgi:hypothetical protein